MNEVKQLAPAESAVALMNIDEEIRRHEASIRWLQIITIINSITCLILAITRMLR